MTTDLQDALHRAVDDLHPDLARIADSARRRGLGIRRRRQVLGAVGAAVSVTAVLAGSALLVDPRTGQQPSADGPARTRLAPAPVFDVADGTRPLTGAATTAGLRDTMASLQAGHADDFAGQQSPGRIRESYGTLTWHPLDGSGVSVLGVNVQPRLYYGRGIFRCSAGQHRCEVTHPTPDSTLMTYEEHTRTDAGTGITLVVDLLRADGLRVSAHATNGLDLGGDRWRVTRARPALSVAQLTTLVQQPWWGRRLPTALGEEGRRLPGYADLDAGGRTVLAPQRSRISRPRGRSVSRWRR